MANQQQKDEFRKKMTFMYLEAPLQLDKDHETFVKDLLKETTPEKLNSYREYITQTFRYYGDDTVEWILSHNYAVLSSIANDTKLLNLFKESRVLEEKRDLIKLMSPAMQVYAFSKNS